MESGFWAVYMLTCVGLSLGQNGQFYGASMSFKVVEGNTTDSWDVQVDVISGWVLGKGPCGAGCSKASVSSSTKASRQVILSADPLYLGNWTREFRLTPLSNLSRDENRNRTKTRTENLNTYIDTNIKETVIAVSELAKWEQDWMIFSYRLSKDNKYMDLTYEGYSWRNLTLQGQNQQWHIQVKVNPEIRSDLNRPNSSPQALSKPFYRLKLNQVNKIQLAVTDPDGDYVKCELSQFVEGGFLASHKLPNISCSKECVITIPTFETLGYTNGSWGAIAVTVRDYNKHEIKVGTSLVSPGSFGLGAVTVEFLVEVLANFTEPIFEDPTPPTQHKFVLYTGSVWSIQVCAKAVPPNTVVQFEITGRQHEPITTTTPVADKDGREGINCSDIKWKPKESEIGEHIFSVTAIDDIGMDTSYDRSYNIIVKKANFTGSSISSSAFPKFIDFPTADELVCEVNSTCLFPLYIDTNGPALNEVKVTKAFVDDYKVGEITKAGDKCPACYKLDLFFIHNKEGKPNVCLLAKDSDGHNSTEMCVQTVIQSKDPCASMPCRNGAKCSRSDSDLSDFVCTCVSDHYFTKDCGKEKSNCQPNPCMNEGTCTNLRGPSYFCMCKPDHTGKHCETLKDKCSPDPCNGHGICSLGDCSCNRRYNGTDCTNDLCPSKPPTDQDCGLVPAGCASNPCSSPGVCKEGGTCACPLGYSGSATCSAKGDISTPGKIYFVDPTPKEGSILNAYSFPYLKIPVFFTDPVVGETPSLSILDKSADLTITVGATLTGDIDGISHIFKSVLEIKPASRKFGEMYFCIQAKVSSHVSEKRCIQVLVVENPLTNRASQEYKEKTATYKFVDPTMFGQSRIRCVKGTACNFFVYTNKASTCEQVVSFSEGVTVFPTVVSGSDCRTEISLTNDIEGECRICMKAADKPPAGGKAVAQTLCFLVDVVSSDPCHPSQCQNGGLCLLNGTNGYQCMCTEGYSGLDCDKGPCPSSSTTCMTGYCSTDNGTESCSCGVGHFGTKCEQHTTDTITNSEVNGAKFTDSGLPKTVTCVQNKPCEVPFVVAGKFSTGKGPKLAQGYISPSVTIGNLTTSATSTAGVYSGTVQLTSNKGGVHPVCIQSLNEAGVNKDEICFEVDVRTDTSLVYGDTSKPHFIKPSLPPNSNVRCVEKKPCHLHFVSSTGSAGHECTVTELTENTIALAHVFDSCAPCVPGSPSNDACHIDLSLTPESYDVGDHHVCVQVARQSPNVRGESRCINVTVETTADFNRPVGCQNLHCENGGFCDGHVSFNPVCHCPVGFKGLKCETDITSSVTEISNMHGVEEIVCSVKETCTLPFKVNGPIVETGYVDPDLVVGKPDITTSGTSEHRGTLAVTPTTPGEHKVCILAHNSLTDSTVRDEKCIKVTVSTKVPDPVDESKPHFLEPTLPKDASIACAAGQPCHVVVHTSTDSTGNCPSVTEKTGVSDGLYMFPPKSSGGECTVDVSYVPPPSVPVGNSTKMCLQVSLPGIKGEERCITALVKTNIDEKGPCAKPVNKDCKNGGKAVADLDSNSCSCVCSMGFKGSDCSDADIGGVTPPSGITGHEQPLFANTAIPDKVVCYTSGTCNIPVRLTGSSDPAKSPVVQIGTTDPALHPGTPVVNTTSSPGQYTATVPLTTSTPGQHELCVQTVNPDTSMNIDEMCFTVDVKTDPGTQTPATTGKPAFKNNLPNNSSVICLEGRACHILTNFNKGSQASCPVIIQTTSIQNVIPLAPNPAASGSDDCEVDTVFTPTSAMTGSQHLCLKPSGSDDTICYDLQVKKETDLAGLSPCKDLHCENSGYCKKTDTGAASCSCPVGFTGSRCENVATVDSTLPGVAPASLTPDAMTPKFDVTSAIPETIKCAVGIPCTVPIIYRGQPDKAPLLGHIDTGLNQVQTEVVSQTPALPDHRHLLQTTLTPSTTGPHKICLQTFLQTGSNIDELCFNVDVASTVLPTPDPANPSFSSKSLPDKSTVQCEAGKTCHLTVVTKPNVTTGNCLPVSECGTGLPGAHVFQPSLQNGVCITDATYTGNSTTTGHQALCLSAGPGGEERKYTLDVKHISNTGPCQKQHCDHGGFCDAAGSGAVCVCKSGFTGNVCQIKTTLPEHMPGGSVGAPGTPKFDTTNAILDTIKCAVGTSCVIPVPYISTTSTPPVLGHVDNGIDVVKTEIVDKPGSSSTDQHIIKTTIKPTASGVHRMCLQTLQPDGTNVDELCFKVNTAVPASTPTYPSKPNFAPETLTSGSTVNCQPGKVCVIPIVTKETDSKCLQVQECGSVLEGLHVQPTDSQSGTCLTDVMYAPKAGITGVKELCISAGPGGSETHLKVNLNPITSTGPCQALQCKNGFCDSTETTPSCICKTGFTGNTCSDSGGTSMTNFNSVGLPANPPTFTDSAIPKTVVCYTGESCKVPFTLTGDPSHKPEIAVVTKDPNLTTGIPQVTPVDPAKKPGQYNAVVSVSTGTEGTHTVCTQTRDPTANVTVDEICFDINMKKGPGPTTGSSTKATIEEPTLPDKSTVICKADFTCHISTTYTKGAGSTQCPVLETAPGSSTMGLVKIFPPSDTGSQCVVDTAVKYPTGSTSQTLCLKPSNGVSARCYTVDVPATVRASPCVTLHCKNGGTCNSTVSSASCVCMSGYEGTHCETVQTTTTVPSTTTLSTSTKVTSASTLAATTASSTTVPTTPSTSMTKTAAGTTLASVMPVSTSTSTTETMTTAAKTTFSISAATKVTSTSAATVTTSTSIKSTASTSVAAAASSNTVATFAVNTAATLPSTSNTATTEKPTVPVSTTASTSTATTTATMSAAASTNRSTASTAGTVAATRIAATDTLSSKTTDSISTMTTVAVTSTGATVNISAATSPISSSESSVSTSAALPTSTDSTTSAASSNAAPSVTVKFPATAESTTMQRNNAAVPVTTAVTAHSTAVTTAVTARSTAVTTDVAARSTAVTTATRNVTASPQCHKKASQHARDMVKAGRVSCSCVVNNRTVQIIKRKPVATSSQLAKAGGIGAGAMTGAMGAAGVIYILVTKMKKKKEEEPQDSRRKPSPRIRARIHPK